MNRGHYRDLVRRNMTDTQTPAVPTPPVAGEKIFGGCGCGSPFAVKMPDGNIELSFPNNSARGKLVVTPQELKALRGMIAGAEKQEKL